jgi:hypothetical protein
VSEPELNELAQDRVKLAPSLRWSSVVGFPAAAALLLGLVYGVGAYSRLEELKHADVPVSVAFPLIPISQHLGRGLQVFLDPFVLAVLGVTAITVLLLETLPPRDPDRRPRSFWGPFRKLAEAPKLVRVPLILVVIAAFALLVPLLLIGGLIAYFVLMFVIASGAPPGERTKVVRGTRRAEISGVLAFVAVILPVGAFALFAEAIDPAPLPSVTLQIVGQQPERGSLITLTDGQWYIWESNRRIRAVDARTVTSAQITEPQRRQTLTENLFQLADLHL